jgi:hypothetical protein
MAIATSTAIIAGAAAAASVGGNIMQAEAQKGIGRAQAGAAGRMREEALVFAAPTSQELENLTKSVNLYDRMYAQSTAMIDQLTEQVTKMYGPAIMEQGKQYYNQLRGEASGVVKSFDNQRSRQREQVRAALIERMGPDALTSSAGVNALNDFDQKTSEMRAGIEEQSLTNAVQRIGGMQEGASRAAYTGLQAFSSMSNLLGSIQKGFGDIQTRQVNAAVGTGEAIARTAGSEYLGQMGYGKLISDLGGQAMRFAGMTGGPSATPEAPTTDTFFSEPTFGESSFSRPTFDDRFSLGVDGVSPGASPSRFDSGNFGNFTFNQ